MLPSWRRHEKLYDLIIAGAGPAGSSAARAAGKMGLKTLVLDKDRFPRYKPCGGGLSERGISYLDFSLPDHICERSITGAKIHFRDLVVERHKDYRLTVTLSRSAFDNLLLEKAIETGIEFRAGTKVESYREDDECVEVSAGGEVLSCRHLLIASGSGSRLQNQVREKEGKDKYGVCVVTEVPEKNSVIDERLNNALDIYFGVAKMGYGWIFPHDGYYSVGIGGLAEHLQHPRDVMLRFLKDNCFDGNYRLHGHLIPFGGIRRNLGTSRVLLAGDSAGFVDSFTGEGISYAIRSGQLAARAVSDKLSDEGLDLVKYYQSACSEDFGEDLRYAMIMARVMHSRPDLFLKILASNGEFVDRYMEVPAMKMSYKGWVRWIIPRLPGFILST